MKTFTTFTSLLLLLSIQAIHLGQSTYFSCCVAQSVGVSTLRHQFPEMPEINMNGAQLRHLLICCQNFPWRSEAYMWQCQSRYINSCAQARWCNPDLWLRFATHGIGNAHVFADVQPPLCSFSLWTCQSKPCSQPPPEAEAGPRTPLRLCSGCHKCWAKRECEEGTGSAVFSSEDSPPIVLSSATNTPLTSDPNLWLLCVSVFLCAPRGLLTMLDWNISCFKSAKIILATYRIAEVTDFQPHADTAT